MLPLPLGPGVSQFGLCHTQALPSQVSCKDLEPVLQFSLPPGWPSAVLTGTWPSWASWFSPGWIWNVFFLPLSVLSVLLVSSQPLVITSPRLEQSVDPTTVSTPDLPRCCETSPWPALHCRWPLVPGLLSLMSCLCPFFRGRNERGKKISFGKFLTFFPCVPLLFPSANNE